MNEWDDLDYPHDYRMGRTVYLRGVNAFLLRLDVMLVLLSIYVGALIPT